MAQPEANKVIYTMMRVSKYYEKKPVLSDISLSYFYGAKIGVLGLNGSGKSSLLKILAGVDQEFEGQTILSPGHTVGYLEQEPRLDESKTVREIVEQGLQSIVDLVNEFNDINMKFSEPMDDEAMNKLIERQGEVQEKLDHLDAWDLDSRLEMAMDALRCPPGDTPVKVLSGGERRRVALCRLLLQKPDILLLDEPTNHLDLEAVEWLENYLLNFRGAVAFVAHDRVFLDKVGSHVLFLGGARPVLRKGSFAGFLEWEAETAQQREREAAKISARIEHEQEYIRRFRVKARKAAQAQSKLKKVEKLQAELSRVQDAASGARPGRSLAFNLPEPRRGDKVAVSAVDLEFAYKGDHKVWHKLNFQLFRGRKIALAAPNGAGKSTLLKLIAGRLTPSHGHVKIGSNTDMAYFSQHQTEILRPAGSVLSEIRRLSDPRNNEEQLMGVLGLFLLGEPYFERPVAALSGGEKSRLLLATLFLARANLLVLDEPTNHLDLESREGLVQALRDYDGTLLFVAHDRYLMSEVADEIWSLSPTGIVAFPGGFEEYDAHRRAEQVAARSAPTAQAAAPAAPAAAAARPKQGKEDKRRSAEIRNRISREMKPLKDEYDTLEKDLDKALTGQAELETALNDPATYADPGKALELNNSYRECVDWVEKLLDRMALLEQEMEELNSRKQELLGE